MLIVCTSTAALLVLAGLLYEYWRSGRLPSLVAPADAVGAVPVVSILIPARNEERGIARCVEGALRQRYPSYEVIVVDDGSTDATPAILARYAAHHPHLRVLHGEALPEGWTGKAFACQRAAAVARGEWLLFLDADTAAAPELLAALLTHVQQQRLDLLSVFPFLELDTFWEQAILPAFRTMIRATFPFQQANAPAAQPGAVFANGQCLLVRRSTYNAIGGHGAVRGDVLEDVLLAQRLRAAGAAVGVAMADQYIRVRMYTNGREVLEGLTKNAVAGFRSGGRRSLLGGSYQYLLALGPFWLALSGLWLTLSGAPLAWIVLLQAGITLVGALACWGLMLHRLYRLPVAYGLLWPIGMVCYGLILLRSVWYVTSGRGVTWKGRTYVGT
ncbi:MAG: glycosyltransferase [Chloroflexaceae bacterium]|nr:glycosyltransferase [Chloroflexaceae bacterium]